MATKKIVLAMLVSSFGYSVGLEKEVMWSGKYGGMVGAATSIAEGPEAMYFNPAGIVTGNEERKNALNFNLSYVPVKVKAPLTTPDDEVSSKMSQDITGSLIYTRQINSQWAAGIGVFPVGGNSIEYDDIEGMGAAPKTKLSVIEISPGVAYRLNEKLSFGLAYRISYVNADYTVILPGPAILQYRDLKDWDFFAFRGGVLYKEQNWGLGLNFRTPVKFRAEGKLEGTAPSDDASLETTFPFAVLIGSHYKFNEHFKLMFDYNFYNYKDTDQLNNEPNSFGITAFPLKWKDGHIFRLGSEYLFTKLALRAGYMLVTAVANKETASPQTEVPAIGHIFSLGAGYQFMDGLEANISGDYSIASTDVDSSATVVGGKYSVVAYALHTGVTWAF